MNCPSNTPSPILKRGRRCLIFCVVIQVALLVRPWMPIPGPAQPFPSQQSRWSSLWWWWRYYNYSVWSPPQVTSTSEVRPQRGTTRKQPATTVWYIPPEPFLEAEELVRKAIGNEQLYHTFVVASNCSVTTQFRLSRPSQLPPEIRSSSSLRKNNQNDNDDNEEDRHQRFWRLQSLSGSNQQPSQGSSSSNNGGGDEFYVIWKSHARGQTNDAEPQQSPPRIIGGDDDNVTQSQRKQRRHPEMLIALIHPKNDSNKGMYDLEFVVPPLIQQQLLQEQQKFLLGDDEDDEDDLGTLTIYYDYTCGIGSLTSPLKDNFTEGGQVAVNFTLESIPRPRYRAFAPPNANFAIDLSQYDRVIFLGNHYYRFDRREFHNWGVRQPLSSPAEMESMLEKLHSWHGADMNDTSKTTAVVTGSGAWDITLQGQLQPDLQQYARAIRGFMQRATMAYPHVDFYWKSVTAIHLHRFGPYSKDEWIPSKSRYLSYGVTDRVRNLQTTIMKELGIPILDLYEASFLSAPWTRPKDSHHYLDPICAMYLSYFWKGLKVPQ